MKTTEERQEQAQRRWEYYAAVERWAAEHRLNCRGTLRQCGVRLDTQRRSELLGELFAGRDELEMRKAPQLWQR
ncbi:MAG: hypothetical protein ACLPJH_00300 [Myxococcaceae bacterium]